ncbi:hypothetical protein GGI03_001891 [Coemansia sp. RSA 2337]|nr:hypothetical protein GGI03_001891 [Coemansia sp. RSA 2337]
MVAESNKVAPFSVGAVVFIMFIMAILHRRKRKQQKERSRRLAETRLDEIAELSFAPATSIQIHNPTPLMNNVAARASVDSQLPVYTQPLPEPPQSEMPPPPPYAPEDPAPRVTKPPSVLLR